MIIRDRPLLVNIRPQWGARLSSQHAPQIFNWLSVSLPHTLSCIRCLQCPVAISAVVGPCFSYRNHNFHCFFLPQTSMTPDAANVPQRLCYDALYKIIFSNVLVPYNLTIFTFLSAVFLKPFYNI